MDFSLMFWGDAKLSEGSAYYEHLLEFARYADEQGFKAVFLPERHFHPWGGFHPNPAVLAAAVASVTKRIKIRAGSVVLPLHNPIRVAEEWSIVDNLSKGRVELAIATGWKDDDFVLAPDRYAGRKAEVWEALKKVQRLWRGETLIEKNGKGIPVSITTYPRPVQAELPLWITSASALQTVRDAGGSGFGLLTHLLGQSYDDVKSKIEQHGVFRARAGFHGVAPIALMMHTFLGNDRSQVKAAVRASLSAYLLNSADLMIPVAQREEWENQDPTLKEELAEIAFERYFETASLMGTPEECQRIVERLWRINVTEICCLIDFGMQPELIREGLVKLAELKDWATSLPPPPST